MEPRGEKRGIERVVAAAPLVSVIIVSFQSEEDIAGCVRSVLASDLPVELILVDNDSQDRTVEKAQDVLGGRPDYEIICNLRNLGFAKAVNIGIERARGAFVLLLNPDCIVEPDTIRSVVEVLEARPNAGMAGCLLLNEDGSEQAGCRRVLPTPWRSLVRVLRLDKLFPRHPRFRGFLLTEEPLPVDTVEVESLSGAFLLARRSAIEAVGRLDEAYFMHCEDLDWCIRFRQAGWKVLFVPFARSLHKKGRSSRSRPVRVEFYKHRGMIRFYNKFLRQRYPGALMWLVVVAVWVRFGIRVSVTVGLNVADKIRSRDSKPILRPEDHVTWRGRTL
jgi:GT2 family glycosyltransferase